MAVPFWKYHGLGNDFIVIDATSGGLLVEAGQARQLCERHTGIGADGVLTVLPSSGADFRMHIFNADGSEPDMCGNGIRCFVKYLIDQGRARGSRVRVETGAGILECRAHPGSDGRVASVAVDMGAVELERERIPMLGEGRCLAQKIELGELSFEVSALRVGVPHLVLFEKADLAMARKRGPQLETHPLFPERTNVDLAEVKNRREIDLVVWERGCGITLACGTGACATVAAACLADRVDYDQEVRVNLPGGTLFVQVQRDLRAVWMRGPAEEVFRGEVELRFD